MDVQTVFFTQMYTLASFLGFAVSKTGAREGQGTCSYVKQAIEEAVKEVRLTNEGRRALINKICRLIVCELGGGFEWNIITLKIKHFEGSLKLITHGRIFEDYGSYTIGSLYLYLYHPDDCM